MIAAYASTHFLVDFACAYLIFQGTFDTSQLYICFLLYNFCAFALQMPLGLLADRFNKNALCAASGCVLVAMAYGFTGVPAAAAVIAGVGNGLFHIGGGIDVLNVSHEKSSALGVFIAPGALGIFLGKIMGGQGTVVSLIIIAVLLTAAFLILWIRLRKGKSFISKNRPVSFGKSGSPAILIALVCLFLVVCLRSYVGMTLAFPWKGEGYWSWALIFAVVLGKAAGGFLADRFGAVKTAGVSLLLAAGLFVLPTFPMAGIASIFLFNMTMPITLWAVARLLPGAKGFSFGLLTFGLFLGFVPVYLGYPPLFAPGAGFSVLAVGSLILLLVGLRRAVQ